MPISYQQLTRKLGRPQAITATAHKLARIVYHLLGTKEAYNESVFHKCEADTIRRAEYRLRRQAAQLDFKSSPQRTVDVPWESASRLESHDLPSLRRSPKLPDAVAFAVTYPL